MDLWGKGDGAIDDDLRFRPEICIGYGTFTEIEILGEGRWEVGCHECDFIHVQQSQVPLRYLGEMSN